ncbi:hypothetical protein BASA81_006117 [Batrachochytrium salamandrivorans]|nr:hypothetical protein BASA81_006117 [Batrachochytrium salamandrivorans]
MSFEQGLKGWEAKKAGVKRGLAQAIQLRESGNDKFRAGELALARELYSQSLDSEETVESLTNRALVQIKLGEFDLAVLDCDRALVLDGGKNVKALARRGTARSGLGEHRAALGDFSLALELEPSNKTLMRERDREEALLQATEVLGGQEEEEMLVVPPQRSMAPPAPSVSINTQVLQDTLLALESTVALPVDLPKSMFGFQNLWRELKGRDALKTELVCKRMQQTDYAQCFHRGIEPDLLQDIVLCAASSPNCQQDTVRITKWLDELGDGIALAKMMLPQRVSHILGETSEGQVKW